MTRGVLSKVGLTGQGKGIAAEAVFDTGATRSFMSPQLAEKLEYVRYDRPKGVLIATKDRKASMVSELIAGVTILGYELSLSHMVEVIEALNHNTIIVMDMMVPYGMLVNAKEGKVPLQKVPTHNRDSITPTTRGFKRRDRSVGGGVACEPS